MAYDTISFLSDYGHADEFVGVVRSVIRSIAPDVAVVDLCHDIAPHDVRAGALLLARSAQYLVPGVVLAVVDPGVGTARRGVAVEVGGGQSVLVGPDNGLLAPAVSMVGGADRAVVLSNAEYQEPAPGATFAGRDVFGPVAAHLAAGVGLAELGEALDPSLLLPGLLPVPREEGDTLHVEVLWVDRYGNAQLNIGPEDIEGWDAGLRMTWAGSGAAGRPQGRAVQVAAAYDDLADGEVGLVVDSYGLLSVVVPRTSAATLLELVAGDAVALVRGGPADGSEGVTTPVELRPRTA
ncbi:MAG: SAM-dependent chlorinase/fluorinase [Acidimicrobiia bacterium]|nr:SAM-dependent chlorinase/fluorinase [Acidimicrobiia bacterium]